MNENLQITLVTYLDLC